MRPSNTRSFRRSTAAAPRQASTLFAARHRLPRVLAAGRTAGDYRVRVALLAIPNRRGPMASDTFRLPSTAASARLCHVVGGAPLDDAFIPFNVPYATGRELHHIAEAIADGHLSGDGTYSRRSAARLSELVGDGTVMLTTSCTHALEVVARLLELGPGDEFIVPAFAFVTTASAFTATGARPIFADIRPDTLNLDEASVERLIGPKTRAVVALHYAGVACALDELDAATAGWSASLVEDNAHGLGGSYRGRPLGSFGRVAAQSFHETKNVQCGEGGALVVNDPALVARAEILCDKGTDRQRLMRGEVDRYHWVEQGTSARLADLNAAYLWGQLEDYEDLQSRRRAVWDGYHDALLDWGSRYGVGLPSVPSECEHPGHLFYLLFTSFEERQRCIAHLAEHGVHAVFHYVPLHHSPFGRALGGDAFECHVAESVSDGLVRLPLYAGLTETQQARVIDAVLELRPRQRAQGSDRLARRG